MLFDRLRNLALEIGEFFDILLQRFFSNFGRSLTLNNNNCLIILGKNINLFFTINFIIPPEADFEFPALVEFRKS